MFPIVRLFFDGKIIVWPWAMVLSSRNNLTMGNTFVDLQNNWRNHIQTIVMSSKQICYTGLDYILQINSEYGLFFCLSEIGNFNI